MRYDQAKEKASRRRNPDKTVQDFLDEAEDEEVENDANWVGFEQQQLNARRKQLSKRKFWSAQDKDTLKRVYKSVFPGIDEAVKHTKAAYMKVIGKFLDGEVAAADKQMPLPRKLLQKPLQSRLICRPL